MKHCRLWSEESLLLKFYTVIYWGIMLYINTELPHYFGLIHAAVYDNTVTSPLVMLIDMSFTLGGGGNLNF